MNRPIRVLAVVCGVMFLALSGGECQSGANRFINGGTT